MQWRIFASLELKKADKKLQRGKSRRGKSRASGDESLQQKDWKYEFLNNNQQSLKLSQESLVLLYEVYGVHFMNTF